LVHRPYVATTLRPEYVHVTCHQNPRAVQLEALLVNRFDQVC